MEILAPVGLVVALIGNLSYVALLLVFHRFTYRTWIFHSLVGVGVVLAVVGWLAGGSGVMAAVALFIGVTWFPLSRMELAIRGSPQLSIRRGDEFPPLSVETIDGAALTERDLIANAPTLLVLYRGWWCPSHKAQLDEIFDAKERLSKAGLSIYAASVDSPEESRPVQERVGDDITILCSVPDAFLDEVGVLDSRGAPWYDRLVFGAEEGEIAMPAAIVVDESGTVAFAARSTRIDDRVKPEQILASV